MKKLYVVLLCVLLVLFGCEKSSEGTESDETAKTNPLKIMREYLEEDISFNISCRYMNLASNGFSQETSQETAKDGNFYFLTVFSQWDRATDYEYNDRAEYYYHYENEELICDAKYNDNKVETSTVGPVSKYDLKYSKRLLVGPEALFPYYLEDFHETDSISDSDICTFSFALPIDDVINDDIFLSNYIKNAYQLCDIEYDGTTEISIICNVESERNTLRPIKISFDFSNLKPYILSESSLSGEEALGVDLLHMIYTFNYELAETIVPPDEFFN